LVNRTRLGTCLGVLILAIAVAPGVCAARARAQTTAGHPRIAWGSNRGTWDQFKSAISGARAVRVYYDQPNVFPAHWPDRAGRNVWTLLSIRPTPRALFHHRLDAELRALIASAPPHSDLTIWHEDAVGNNPLGYPRPLRRPATYRRMQTYMEHLVHGTNVRFGTIGCGPVNQAEKWYAPHLDWYGFDLFWNPRYDGPDGHLLKAKVWARLDANLTALRQVSGERHPMIRIGESNAAQDFRRRAWFTDVASWFAAHDGGGPAWILTYWNAKHSGAEGGLSGPWPPSAPVVRRLRRLIEGGR
jgi:hypothetical protein